MKKLISIILTILCLAIPAYAVQVTIDVPQTHIDYVTARANEAGITPVDYLLKIIYGDYINYKINEYRKAQEEVITNMETAIVETQVEQQELLMNYIISLTGE